MKEIVLSVKGLHCANCAAKIEKKINEMNEVDEATLDLMGEKIIINSNIEYNIENENFFVKGIQKIADSIEDGVVISSIKKAIMGEHSHGHSHSHDHGHSHEYGHSHSHDGSEVKDILKKLIVGGLLFFAAIFFPFKENHKILLYVFSYVIIGGSVLNQALKNIERKSLFDENFLMAIATIGAFIVGEYAEGVAVMLFYQIGELFQEMAVAKSKKSITSLMDIRPDYANIEVNAELKKVSPETIKIGDIIVVKPGEKVPLDGEIILGETAFDTSALTGESLPKEIGIGDEVLSGYINKTGLVKIKVNKTFEESTVFKILDLVQNASSKKSKTEKFITKFAQYYTPAVVIIALLLGILPPLFIKGATFVDWGYRALVFLVVSCPCALVISIPLGFFGGIGGASKHGILIKGANYLEALNNVETVVFDKTGTLTKGTFKVEKINVELDENVDLEDRINETELLRIAAYAESYSTHPIAMSIVSEYEKNGTPVNKNLLFNFQEISGQGIKVNLVNDKILAGNIKLMNNENVKLPDNFEETQKNVIGTVVYIAVNGNYVGNIVINDEIKEDAKKAIDELNKLGINDVIMLTGDNKKIADNIANKLNIKRVFSELLPTGKVEKIEELFDKKLLKEKATNKKNKILFVGDGINDAPVLARADIGVAMGGVGSDAAIEAADIVIMTDEPSKIPIAIKIAKHTKSIVWQNIIFALGVKAIILLMGAGGHATMWEAVFADVGVAIIAILNATRVMRIKIKD